MYLNFSGKLGLLWFFLLLISPGWAAEPPASPRFDALPSSLLSLQPAAPLPGSKDSKTKPIKFSFNNQSIYTSINLEGDGKANATSLDMSLTEADLFSNNTLANGTLITRSSAYPIVGSSAFTTDSRLKLEAQTGTQSKAGVEIQIYTMSDTDSGAGGSPADRTARVFGAQQPFGHYTGIIPGTANPWDSTLPASAASLWNAYLANEGKNYKWKFAFGNQTNLLGRGYTKFINMEHFLFRVPVSGMSILAHQVFADKDLIQMQLTERQPAQGLKFEGEAGGFNWNLFSLYSDETPRTVNSIFHFSGGRIGYRTKDQKLGLGFSLVGADHDNPRTAAPAKNRAAEQLTGFDLEYKISPNAVLYGGLGSSDYRENGSRDGKLFKGNGQVLGINYMLTPRLMADLRYQYQDKNFEPLKTHKKDFYPYNYDGLRYELKYLLGEKGKAGFLGFQAYSLQQVDPNISTSRNPDTDAQADYIPWNEVGAGLVNAEKGKIASFTPQFDYTFPKSKIRLAGYSENMRLYRGIDASGRAHDKKINNLSLWLNLPIGKKFTGILGYRGISFTGNWWVGGANYNFNQQYSIPKIGFSLKPWKDGRLTLLYNNYTFKDSSPVTTAGLNDWDSNVFIMEMELKY